MEVSQVVSVRHPADLTAQPSILKPPNGVVLFEAVPCVAPNTVPN